MRALLLPSIAWLISAGPAFGWGCEGHQIVALIARAHLTPAASAAVDRLLAANPMDPSLNRFCKDRPADPMADAATWADDTKRAEKTGVWHYVDIPLTATGGLDLSAWCPPIGPSTGDPSIGDPSIGDPSIGDPSTRDKDRPGCVTDALEYEWDILLDTSRTGAERATALRYVIHFVGDMHQPLHDSNNDDQGGNCTALRFYEEEKPVNLHAVWDYKLIQRELTARKETQADFARALDRQFADRWQAWGTPAIDPTAWAWESNTLARTVTYGNLKPAIPVEQPGARIDCATERDKVSALHIAIGDSYFNAAIPVVDEQLAKAGYRLADLLNRTF
jgi:hypothetical protein